MESLLIILIVSVVFAVTLGAAWLDSKYPWQLSAWLQGQCSNPFKATSTVASANDSAEIRELRERIEILERIVTEPNYELKRQFAQLK